jgi:hypothetical protein
VFFSLMRWVSERGLDVGGHGKKEEEEEEEVEDILFSVGSVSL